MPRTSTRTPRAPAGGRVPPRPAPELSTWIVVRDDGTPVVRRGVPPRPAPGSVELRIFEEEIRPRARVAGRDAGRPPLPGTFWEKHLVGPHLAARPIPVSSAVTIAVIGTAKDRRSLARGLQREDQSPRVLVSLDLSATDAEILRGVAFLRRSRRVAGGKKRAARRGKAERVDLGLRILEARRRRPHPTRAMVARDVLGYPEPSCRGEDAIRAVNRLALEARRFLRAHGPGK